MNSKHFILAIDQGTTSSRSMLFDQQFLVAEQSQYEFPQYFPESGWVEHNPEDIWQTTLKTCNDVIAKTRTGASNIAAIGITNQRETTIVWERSTGKPIYNAIVWQDRRTASLCTSLKRDGIEPLISAKTGLLLDPYFSATKIAWILDNVSNARLKAERGELAFGTVDSWLLWKLTEGKVHATDATNASRTMLYNIHSGDWDEELLEIFNVPRSMLPVVKNSADDFGTTTLFGSPLKIYGIAGDQQAAAIGQACFEVGMMKSTYGTGCFALLNTGDNAVNSTNRLLTTIAYQLDGKVTYALEGSIFIAGAAVQWLRDGLGIIESAEQSGALALHADPNEQVYMVPAFTGLGAPWWNADTRGAIFGLTRNTGPAEIAKAALESVCYQTLDLLTAMRADWNHPQKTVLRVDGGMVASDWTMQCLADILESPVERPSIIETTAIGVAWLAGSKTGLWPNQQEFVDSWHCQRRFEPKMEKPLRDKKVAHWNDAINRLTAAPQKI